MTKKVSALYQAQKNGNQVSHAKERDGQKLLYKHNLMQNIEKTTEMVAITVAPSHGGTQVTCIDAAGRAE